jgi:hypothetical protein
MSRWARELTNNADTYVPFLQLFFHGLTYGQDWEEVTLPSTISYDYAPLVAPLVACVI